MKSQKEIDNIAEISGKKVQKILRELESNVPGITEGFGAITGVGIGGATSLFALSSLGMPGLSAAGITSGLAQAGSFLGLRGIAFFGSRMVAGIAALFIPIMIFGTLGYYYFKRRKIKKQVVAVQHAMTELYSVIDKLRKNAEVFKEEIVGIKILINSLEQRAPS